jgi:hypothetical protein
LQVSERAWVNAESIEILTSTVPGIGSDDLSIGARIAMKNTGKSTATDGFARMRIEPNDVKTPTKEWKRACQDIEPFRAAVESGSTPWPVGFVLAPGQSAPQVVGDTLRGLTADKMANGYYILGCTTYKDQFDTRRTTFCFQPNEPSDPSKGFTVCNGFQEAK